MYMVPEAEANRKALRLRIAAASGDDAAAALIARMMEYYVCLALCLSHSRFPVLQDSDRDQWLWLEYARKQDNAAEELSADQHLAAFSALSKYTALRCLRLHGENSRSIQARAHR